MKRYDYQAVAVFEDGPPSTLAGRFEALDVVAANRMVADKVSKWLFTSFDRDATSVATILNLVVPRR